MAERLTVDQDVVGSTPISHPKRSQQASFFNDEMEDQWARYLGESTSLEILYQVFFQPEVYRKRQVLN